MKQIMRQVSDISTKPRRGEEGIALLIAIVALTMFSLLSLYMVLNATTEVRISDNQESQLQATYAAEAGMNHAREVLKGIEFDDLLKGPDGAYNNSGSYMTTARTFSYRNPVTWSLARSLNIFNPASDMAGVPDDGVVSTGKTGSTNGTQLISFTGIALTAPNPYGAGTVTTGRYFVKVADNNGEASELAADISDNPFHDGDGIIVVRSMGVSKTINEVSSTGTVRANSVAVVEARFKAAKQFLLDSPMVVQGKQIVPSGSNMFAGNSFNIDGLGSNFGISTIDTNTSDANSPYANVFGQISPSGPNQYDNICGNGICSNAAPSMSDITATVTADADKSKLLDPAYLYNFVTYTAPGFADNVITGPESISGSDTRWDFGYFDYTKPYNDPSQRPRTSIVNGDLTISGGFCGGGLLIVTGTLTGNGSMCFNGLVLVVGKGETNLSGVNVNIHGGVYTVNVTEDPITHVISFGTTKLSLGGNSNIIFDATAISLGTRLIPAVQLSWREIRSQMDPN